MLKKYCFPNLIAFLSLCIMCFTNQIHAQGLEYSFENIGIQNGISQSSVLTVLQDHKGFLWFGTQDGLNRYDGYNFKIYRPSLEFPTSNITDGLISVVSKTKDGLLLIGTSANGFDIFDQKNNKFINFKSNSNSRNSIASDNITDFFFDKDDAIWVTTEVGFSKISFPLAGRFDSVVIKNFESILSLNTSIKDTVTIKKIADRNGNYIFYKDGDYYFVEKKNVDFELSFQNKLIKENLNKISGCKNIMSIGLDRMNNFWIIYKRGMEQIIDFKKHQTKWVCFKNDFNLKPKTPPLIGSDSCIYSILNGDGVMSFQYNTGLVTHIKNNIHDNKSLYMDDVTNVFEDNKGIIWFTTRDGISKYNWKKNSFTHFDIKPGASKWLQNKWPFCFEEDKLGQIWIGSYMGTGIDIYNKKNNTFSLLTPSKSPGALTKANDILDLFRDSENNMWVCTYGSGLGLYNDQTNTLKFFTHDAKNANSLPHNTINGMCEDKKRNLFWIATKGGVSSFDKKTKVFVNYYPSKDSIHIKGEKSNQISGVLLDEDETIWLATETIGLIRMNLDASGKAHYKQYLPIAHDASSISSNQLFSINNAADGCIWIGTNGAGLVLFNPKTEKFKRYTVKDGLANNVVYGMQLDCKKRLWVSTNFGLSMFNLKTQEFKNYTVNNGLQSNEFNQGAYFTDSQGLMYFGGVRGYNVFNPLTIAEDKSSAEVVFTDFKLFNQSILPGLNSPLHVSISNAEQVELNYNQRDFTFEFTAINYASPVDNQFAYKIEGYHKDWVYLGRNHTVSFTGFPHGDYILKVKASNADGIWSTAFTQIRLIIQPPFYKTNLFYVLVFLTTVVLILFFIKHREKKLLCDKNKLEKTVAERTKKVCEQVEELKVQKEEILAQTEELESINEELEKLSLVASKTDNAVIIMDKHGNVEWINEGFTKLYGYTQKEFTQKFGLNIVQNSQYTEIQQTVEKCLNEKLTVSYESKVSSKTQGEIWSQTTLTPILNEKGCLVKIVAIDSNISKLKAAQELIFNQNKQITDSIQYAKRIQKAIMPPQELMNDLFSESFIFLKPRDIVSGDFFWANRFWCQKTNSEKIVIAVADCTGHGVPGAFMSMLGIAFLNDIVNNANKLETEISAAKILEELRGMIIRSLHQTGQAKENKDGMDISLCVIDKTNNILQFAGANNSLFLIRNGVSMEIKADRMPVGIYHGHMRLFENHECQMLKDDLVYLYTDGFHDQFGGLNGRKYMRKNFKELLFNISSFELSVQKKLMKDAFDNWTNHNNISYDQIDDITVLGFKY